ncbi:transposable element Tcb2 transposase [Caerostris darwini]|uniref:Transposable element Tcb2 transposase n=1 Tax=Caerostris darwini TaxID=1538125 RepID=A0AAV4UA56_9ARAC|nr:transposable element Tcb2 transposase [Caerostris darwini]
MEKISDQPYSYPKNSGWLSKGYGPRGISKKSFCPCDLYDCSVHWSNVMFPNELHFALKIDDKHVRDEEGTCNRPQNITHFLVEVWTGISLGYRTDHLIRWNSMTTARYRKEVPDPIERLYAATVDRAYLLMDDNALPHRAMVFDHYLDSEGNARIKWPAYPLKTFGIP